MCRHSSQPSSIKIKHCTSIVCRQGFLPVGARKVGVVRTIRVDPGRIREFSSQGVRPPTSKSPHHTCFYRIGEPIPRRKRTAKKAAGCMCIVPCLWTPASSKMVVEVHSSRGAHPSASKTPHTFSSGTSFFSCVLLLWPAHLFNGGSFFRSQPTVQRALPLSLPSKQ